MPCSGFWRELTLRVGLTAALAAIAVLWLGADPWIWVMPAGVAVLVAAKWLPRRPPDDDDRPPPERRG